MWKECEIKNRQREQISRKWRGMETRMTEIAMGDCIKSDLEKVGEDWNKNDRRNWRLLTENVVREK